MANLLALMDFKCHKVTKAHKKEGPYIPLAGDANSMAEAVTQRTLLDEKHALHQVVVATKLSQIIEPCIFYCGPQALDHENNPLTLLPELKIVKLWLQENYQEKEIAKEIKDIQG